MPVKIKVFAVVMAVMCVMSLMCVTAFAAEADLPPGAHLMTSGDSIENTSASDLEAPYVIPADGTESITITGLFYFSEIHGWDGAQWHNLTGQIGDVADSVTFDVADYPQYSYFTVVGGRTGATSTFTFTWTKSALLPKILTAVGVFVGTVLTAVGAPVLAFITSSPLTLIPALAGLLILGILVVRRFVYGA